MTHFNSDNAGFFSRATLRLSTIQLPIEIDGCWYESCIFSCEDSEIIGRHKTLEEAAKFHVKKAKELKLKRSY